jgi:hypothetical protein
MFLFFFDFFDFFQKNANAEMACVLFGECTIWRMYHLANEPFGECAIW